MKIQSYMRSSHRFNSLSLSASVRRAFVGGAFTFSAFAVSAVAHSTPMRNIVGVAPNNAAANVAMPSVAAPNIGMPNVAVPNRVMPNNAMPSVGNRYFEKPNFDGPDTGRRNDSNGRDSKRNSRSGGSVNINIGIGGNSGTDSTPCYNQPYSGYGYPNYGYGGNVVVIGNGVTVVGDSSSYVLGSPINNGYPIIFGPQFSTYGLPRITNVPSGVTIVGYPPYASASDSYNTSNTTNYNTTNYYGLPASAYYFDPSLSGNAPDPNAAYWNSTLDAGYYDPTYYDPNVDYSNYSTMGVATNGARSATQRAASSSTNARAVPANNAAGTVVNDAKENSSQWADGATWSANEDGTPATVPTWPSDVTTPNTK